MTEESKPGEPADLEGILSDLDAILTGKAPGARPQPQGGPKPPAPAEEVVPPELSALFPGAPAAGARPTSGPAVPERKAEPPPSALPAPGAAAAENGPAAAPGAANAPGTAAAENGPAAAPGAANAPGTAAAENGPAAASPPPISLEGAEKMPEEMRLELAPREGLPPQRAPAASAPKPKPPPSQTVAGYKPPMELSADSPATAPASAAENVLSPAPAANAAAGAAAAENVLPPAPAASTAAGTAGAENVLRPAAAVSAPDPARSIPAIAPAAGSADAPPVRAVQVEDKVPPNTPKDQIRNVAILYGAGQAAGYAEFAKFVDNMALHFTKKPLYLRKTLVAELRPDDGPQAILDRIKDSGAAGVVGLLGESSEAKLRSLEEPLTNAGVFFRWIPLEEVKKRTAAVDLLVDLTLLGAG